MKKAPRKRVAGIGTAMGAVIFLGSMGLGCQPGTLPCDKPEWKSICESDGGGVTSSGGSSGSGGTTGGMGGSSGSGGGSGTPDAGGGGVTAATPIMNCSDFKTVGDMDKFFGMRCGEGATCHPTTAAATFGDLKSPDVFKRIVTKSSLTCTGVKLADTSDYTKGLIWAKTEAMPKCPGGTSAAGAQMPSMPMMPLSATEKTCLENYLKALAGK
jgi:hypothetical protein